MPKSQQQRQAAADGDEGTGMPKSQQQRQAAADGDKP